MENRNTLMFRNRYAMNFLHSFELIEFFAKSSDSRGPLETYSE